MATNRVSASREPPDCTFGVALAMLATAGRDGVTEELLSALGFDASMIAGLVNTGEAGDPGTAPPPSGGSDPPKAPGRSGRENQAVAG
jgi:hypothetical protein